MKYILLFVAAFNFLLFAQWEKSNFPDKNRVGCLAAEGNNIYAGTWGEGIFLSTNNGIDWILVNNGLPVYHILELFVNGSDIYAGTWTYEGSASGIFKSTNNGALWTYIGSGITNNSMITSFALKDSNIYVGTYWSEAGGSEIGDIYVSSDNGEEWVNILPSPFPITSLLISENYIFAARFFGYPCRSRLDSINWQNMTSFYPEPRIEAFGAIDNKILASVASEYYPLHISEDYGENWSLVFSPLVKYITTFITVGNNIYAGRQNDGVVFSTDHGTTWAEFNEGMPAGISIYDFVFSEHYLYAASDSGLWIRPLSNLTTVDQDVDIAPKLFSLSQNYPNPFNPITVINYSIPEGLESKVTLRIFDLLGHEIAVLVNEEKPAGEYKVEWNASSFSSGVYFYRLQAIPIGRQTGEFSSTKKLLLMK